MEARGSSSGPLKVAQEILSYLIKHPDAKDTVEGILKWWLPEEREEFAQSALDFLVSKGWVTKKETTPSQKIYGFNNDYLQEIKNFLKGSVDEKEADAKDR